MKFTAEKDKIYVLQTSDLAFAADTVIELYNTDGAQQLAQNDDYGYTSASRITWEAPADGVYYARIRHVNVAASGPNTQYDFAIHTGFCNPDDAEGDDGDNGPGDASTRCPPTASRNRTISAPTRCAKTWATRIGSNSAPWPRANIASRPTTWGRTATRC